VLLRALHSVRDGLLGLAYPEECRICGSAVESWDDGVACDACWSDASVTPLFDGDVCVKCGSPMTRVVSPSRSAFGSSRSCGLCSAFAFNAARACGTYSGALEANILFLKTNPHICNRLRLLIEHTFSKHREALSSDVVVPVPLHRLREKQRGFNQAAIVANAISRKFNMPTDDQLILRSKPTERHRAGLDALDRARSVEQAFAVSVSLSGNPTVLLIDDVYTTGSTIRSATRCLIEAGAGSVNVLTIARVV